jgi:hypothetical protein
MTCYNNFTAGNSKIGINSHEFEKIDESINNFSSYSSLLKDYMNNYDVIRIQSENGKISLYGDNYGNMNNVILFEGGRWFDPGYTSVSDITNKTFNQKEKSLEVILTKEQKGSKTIFNAMKKR